MIDNNLIYILGGWHGEDSLYFLDRGFNVVCVEANPDCVAIIKRKCQIFLESGQLILIEKCISDVEGKIDFYCSQSDEWSSCHVEISNRKSKQKKTVKVDTVNLQELFDEHGVPVYCKIDIEGEDHTAINMMVNKPKFISAESECVGNITQKTDDDILKVLNAMKNAGYTKFHLIRQTNNDYLGVDIISIFGNKINIPWISYDELKDILLKESYNHRGNIWSYWKDILATF